MNFFFCLSLALALSTSWVSFVIMPLFEAFAAQAKALGGLSDVQVDQLVEAMTLVPNHVYHRGRFTMDDLAFRVLLALQVASDAERGGKVVRDLVRRLRSDHLDNSNDRLTFYSDPFEHTQSSRPPDASLQAEHDQLTAISIENVLADMSGDGINLNVNVRCRVCKYDKANQVARQRRSGDEGMDVFHVCTQCGSDYRV
jgi:DNA-directed RNA polymerase subunit M/transcription elongation factor TFIIS